MTSIDEAPEQITLNLDQRQRSKQKRRAVSRAVSDVRERLTSSTGTRPAFDHELMLSFAKNRLSAAAAIPLLGIVAAVTLSVYADNVLAFLWLFGIVFTHSIQLSFCRRFERIPVEEVKLRSWRGKFVFGEFIYGMAWAALPFVTSTAEGQVVEIFQFATMIIVIAVGTMLASSLPVAAFAGTAPIALALGFRFLMFGDIAHVVMAAAAVGAQVLFVVLANRLHATSLIMLEFRAEKDALIAELEQAKAMSDESRRRAEEANLAKSRFLATISHELRTPLNAILGFSEVLKAEILGPLPNDQYREYAADIHQSGEHLLNLINEILDLSRIEAGRYKLSEESVLLPYIAEDGRHLLELKAKNKNITVVERYEPELPRIWADERAVRQIVLNLLSNAIKFTPIGGEITIKVGWTASGGQYVSIRDSGPGIPESEIPVILSAFGQGSIAIKSAEQGTGLGLPIVQGLMRMHGGTFELKSKLRAGTEVICTFPAKRVMEAMPAFEDRGGEPKDKRPSKLQQFTPARGGSPNEHRMTG